MANVRILIVEDELIISRDMTNMLSKMGYDVIGDAMNYDEAIAFLEVEKLDLILLDINLNGKKDGVDLAEEINQKYNIPFIYTTSYSDKMTLERVKLTNPANYLVKPFKEEQLFTAIELAFYNLAKKSHELHQEANETEALNIKGALFIKDKYRYTKINISDIQWIKSDGNYLEIHTINKTELIRSTMENILERLQDNRFFRTQKSYIVNLDFVTKIETNQVMVSTTSIPISKNYHDELLKRLNII